MSPTSYRTAPPRDVDCIVNEHPREVKQIVAMTARPQGRNQAIPERLRPHRSALVLIAFSPPLCYYSTDMDLPRPIAAAAIVLILCGATLLRSSVFRDEISLYQDTSERSPLKARPFNNLGDALLKAGRYEEARVQFERALSLDPNYPDALNNLGTVYNHEGHQLEAIQLITAAIRLQPDHRQARFNLAVIYYENGMIAEAAEQFRIIIDLAPWSGDADFARTMLAMIQARGRSGR
jgi:tetratricopeptide (TPR) repeat protein